MAARIRHHDLNRVPRPANARTAAYVPRADTAVAPGRVVSLVVHVGAVADGGDEVIVGVDVAAGAVGAELVVDGSAAAVGAGRERGLLVVVWEGV